MKRFLVAFLVLLCFVCGCKNDKKIELRTDFLSFGCNADYNGDKYSFDVKTKDNGEMECLIKYPETLSGMKCLVGKDKITVDYKGIEIEKKLEDIPFGSVISLFYAVLDDTKGKTLSEKNGDFCIYGKANGIDYKFSATEEGLPISLSFDSEKIFMEFIDLTLVNS